MFLLIKFQRQCKRNPVTLLGEWTIIFVSLLSIHFKINNSTTACSKKIKIKRQYQQYKMKVLSSKISLSKYNIKKK